ncbi:Midasin [Mycena kentingensis (nom. inval.)]|nr:Midasin [Mycena kentingensis (nom. inval.)]
MNDPLVLSRAQTRKLVAQLPPDSHHLPLLNAAQTTTQLCAVLSSLLASPDLTWLIANTYRSILLHLCALWLDEPQNTEDQLAAICDLVQVHEELFPVLHAMLLQPQFFNGPIAFVATIESPTSIETRRLQRLLLAYYRILQANRELPGHHLWSLLPLSQLIWATGLDGAVRLLAIRCYALQSGMGEAEREKLENEVFGDAKGVELPLEYAPALDGTPKEVDAWILPFVEVRRVHDLRQRILQPLDLPVGDLEDVMEPVTLSRRLHFPLVPTPTTSTVLRSLATRISLRLPTLISSPPSSGKSLILSHLADLLHPGDQHHLVPIHLADTSLDPRSLLGSYVSSTTQPGTFEWKEGVLVRAMRQGKWVVLEDVDRGSNEVLGVLKPLVESLGAGRWIGQRASLQVPSRGRVVAADGFAIFATRSCLPSRNGAFPPPLFFGAHKFEEVVLPTPTTDELQTIINSRFPLLRGTPTRALINLWESLKALGSTASTRDIGLRELDKFCTRLTRVLSDSFSAMEVETADTVLLSSVFTNPALREEIYLEARDVFFGAGATTTAARGHTQSISEVIARHLGLDTERSAWVLNGRVPEWFIERDANGQAVAARVGRTVLSARPAQSAIPSCSSRPFAMHRPAICLLSRISAAVALGEPVLLTGETGTGKTSAVTHLSSVLRRPLISLNLSHQTESADLVGGFKPIDARIPASALQERFSDLFGATFSRKKNATYEEGVRKAVLEGNWKRAVALWKGGVKSAKENFAKQAKESMFESNENTDAPRKKRRIERSLKVSEASWIAFEEEIEQFEIQHVQAKGKFAFGFVEGPLVKALRSGDWVLLDEINLASPETLECISSLLHSPTSSITLTEQGSLEAVPRHPDFRIFACMNPATDVGKKDLPPNIRSRFTEIDVPPPDSDRETLLSIVTQYIGDKAVGDKAAIMDVAMFYSTVKDLAEQRRIADGSNHRPHFSMRTLARALTFAADIASAYGLRRALWEGCLMAFTMVLDAPSAQMVRELAEKHITSKLKNQRSALTRDPAPPQSGEFIKLGPFYIERGPAEPNPVEDYIMTPSVEVKLIDLARIITTRRFPVLIEGPTSSGKTSSVEYLAKRTGHRFVRINNHEHTDIQEYIGSYVSDPATGKLVFKDGLLVRALRNGDWIVLDELNLAPTDVLEALNRLLDDNRELVIPETQEVVRPHPHFMLFATQNPPGLYAGRKVLSRAFRNRFLEVHFDDVPQTELETILCQRCRIAPSYGKKIVTVFTELQKRRQAGRVFETKQGFATLRDLFRWAGRDAGSYDELAVDGYMLLAERARRQDDKVVVKEVIESILGVKIDERTVYDLHKPGIDFGQYLGCPVPSASSELIWTRGMQRTFVLVSRALRFNEPVLLVGETGCGKTSVCQIFAATTAKRLYALNCHQNTETADLIGGLRPVRNRAAREAEVYRVAVEALQPLGVELHTADIDSVQRSLRAELQSASLEPELRSRLETIWRDCIRTKAIFEWHDGPLVEAMHAGDVFLLDEISLADDSVLERLNSVLEPARTLVLAERGGDDLENPMIRAEETFKLVATMNPGGDYGKKELSPALRNRFTEIWVPPVDERGDLELIVDQMWRHAPLRSYTAKVLDFTEWLSARVGDRSLTSLRDILAWVEFSNSVYSDDGMTTDEIFHHAANMTFLDGLASLPQLAAYTSDAIRRLKNEAQTQLDVLAPFSPADAFIPSLDPRSWMQLGAFAVRRGAEDAYAPSFNLGAPTSQDNAVRVVRALQVHKPILLEGSPGVGKTSLVTALAQVAGHRLCRINLSDQTDIADLFGSDLPIDGQAFAWKDAEFLTALQRGDWVLLDEMNLAPQAVLEGLNAVLDHRGTVYIPELSRSFTRHPNFRIFAAQNPLNQGGGRKGLPKSFVNRFTKVYVEELMPGDLLLVCQHLFPAIDQPTLRAMIEFNSTLNHEVSVKRSFARAGSPWEFNLRDVLRWASLLRSVQPSLHPGALLRSVYLERFREPEDRLRARQLFDRVFQAQTSQIAPSWAISSSYFQIGSFHGPRQNFIPLSRPGRVLKSHLAALESVGHCISQSWLAIITGSRNDGKSEMLRVIASLAGRSLREVHLNSASDTMDILGSFEQVDRRSHTVDLVDSLVTFADSHYNSATGSSPGYHIARDNLLRARHARSPDILQAATAVVETLSLITNDPAKLQSLYSRLQQSVVATDALGDFEWVDGPLVRAMKQGEWIVLDGANLCSPSILDRLNSLCEPNGFLTLSERGYVDGAVQVINPHPDFRIFMTVDPQYGELSRAMRNRGIEVYLSPAAVPEDACVLQHHLRLPSVDLALDKFDWLRRGLRSDTSFDEGGMFLSGRAVDHHSSLSSFLDYPFPPAQPSVALLYFLARSIPPPERAVIRSLLSYFKGAGWDVVLNLAEQIPSKELETAFLASWNAQSWAPLEFISGQPLSFVLNALNKIESDSSALPLLRAVDLDVALFAHLTEVTGTRMVDKSRLSVEIEAAVAAAQNASIGTLQRLASPQWSCQTTPELASKTLRLASELRKLLTEAHLDYSTVHVLTDWLVTTVKDCPLEFEVLAGHARTLRDLIALSSGLGMKEIWRKISMKGIEDVRALEYLDQLALGLEDPALRRQCFDIVCLRALKQDESNEAMEKLEADLISRLENARSGPHISEAIIDFDCLAVELGLVSAQTLDTMMVERLIQVECARPSSSLLRLVGYQHLAWARDAGTDTFSALLRIQMRWLTDVWASPGEEGPARLFRPFQLSSVFSSTDLQGSPLTGLAQLERAVRRGSELASLQSRRSLARVEQLGLMLDQSMSLIAACFSTEAQNSMSLVDSPIDSRHPVLREAAARLLKPAFARWSAQPTITELGWSWIGLSRLIFELFVPDAPVDPAAMQNCAIRFLENEESLLAEQKRLHSQLEQAKSGSSENVIVRYLDAQLAETRVRLRDEPIVPKRGNVSRVHLYWSEVAQFQVHVVSKVHPLLDTLDEQSLPRENVLQQSMAGFCQRLDSAYPDFADLSTPLKLATMYLRLGLRLVASTLQSSSSLDRFSTALVAFPSVQAATDILALSTSPPVGITPIRQILLSLSAVAYNGVETRLAFVETAYAQAQRLWLIDLSRRKEEGAESSSLYRRKDYKDIGDAEMEEREFLALFPSFEDVFEDPGAEKGTVTPGHISDHVLPADCGLLSRLHFALFDDGGRDILAELRRTIVDNLVKSHFSSLSDSIDATSLPFQLSTLHRALSSLATPPTASFNFYTDHNVAESKKATHVVQALQQRLQVLVEEWPDQMVLHHLIARCGTVLALDLASPVAKVLSALEQLLLQTADWEIYSNRHNTLKEHQTALTNLIVEWRRMELSCWSGILQSQAREFEAGVAEWWFNLYDATVRGPLDAIEQEPLEPHEALTKYLTSLIPLLDDFIRGSPLGQFSIRMRFLGTFEVYCTQLAATKAGYSRIALDRVSHVLNTTRSYFSLFSSNAASRLWEQRSTLEKELRGFIKLASWKDVNVQALKASAQRTHHQLYKLIRKFRDILRQPVTDCMRLTSAGEPEAQPLRLYASLVPESFPVPDFPPAAAKAIHLDNLARTFERFAGLLSTNVESAVNSHSALVVDDLAVNIIATSKQLAAVAIPAAAPAEKRVKLQKALTVRKRKAWSDLLKELRRAGFSATPKANVLTQQADMRWLREQPKLMEDTGKSDEYFHRLVGLLPGLRSSLSNHHPDVVTRDLQKGVMFVESVFSMAVDARARLADALKLYQKLNDLYLRLGQLAECPSVTCHSTAITDQIRHLTHALDQLVMAIAEITEGIRTFASLHNSAQYQSLIDETIQLEAVTITTRDVLKTVIGNVCLSPQPILLQDEYLVVSDAFAHLQHVEQSFQRWLDAYPSLRHLFAPTITWIQSQSPTSFSANQTAVLPLQDTDLVIDLLLVHVQALVSACPVAHQDTAGDRFIESAYHVVRNITQLLKLQQTVECLDGVLLQLAVNGGNELAARLNRFLPFVELYRRFAQRQIIAHSEWTKALFKLDYVLCSIASTLAKDGFCQPPDGDSDEAGGQTVDSSDGVGLGSGEGTQNASKEIEEESQVEGLKGDDKEDSAPPPEQSAEDDAIEMSEDIGGELEDMPEDGKDEGEEDDDDDEASNADPEEHLGDLNASDPSAVDEKLWGDEKGPDDSSQKDDKTNKEHSEEQTGDSEVVAKEGEQQAKPKEEKNGEQTAKKDELPVTEPEDEEAAEGQDDRPDASAAPMEDHMPDANTLDLPDDINLDNDQDAPDGDMEMDDMPEDEMMDEDGPEPAPERLNEPEQSEDSPMEDNAPPENDKDALMESAQQESEESDTPAEDDTETAIARPDVSPGEGDVDPYSRTGEDVGQSASTGQAGSSAGAAGHQATASEDKAKDEEGPSQSNQEDNVAPSESQLAGTVADGTQEGQAQSESNTQLFTNPLRSLGDALKEIRRRFDEILEANDDPTKPPLGDDTSKEAEYLRPDDEDHDMQALGPAGEEQVAKLNELTLLDEVGANNIAPMDIDEASATEQHQDVDIHALHQDQRVPGQDRDDDGAIVHDTMLDGERRVSAIEHRSLPAQVDDGEDVEVELRKWQADGVPESGAERIWRLYESLTHDLAYALCEQLRLILEPTLATRLKGDYRTGKRLNMKKIISYIASDYTKDKIWLRRTRPSQREYQILLSLDDSKSMAESHSVHLAFQTLALVAKSLTRLEAGDVAIAKFGQTVDILHGFEDGPFTDQAGTKLMSAFRFDQTATNMLSLIDASLRAFEAGRERRGTSSATAADLWQLQIIISDGVWQGHQDHDKLRTMLRKAEEQRVMIVFIIVDSLHSAAPTGGKTAIQRSILKMEKAVYKDNQIQLERYLDSFPFEYYVVLREVDSLPDVFSGLLRQFFARISEE